MRTIKFILTICTAFALLNACDESSFLEEKPLDFYTPDNSMQTSAHFQASVNFLYNQVRYIYWEMNPDTKNALYYATDFAFNATDYYKPAKLNDYRATMVPTFSVVDAIWSINYKIIANANIILDRLPAAEKVSEENKKVFRGEALFFRAYAYRFLGHLYGGVPLTLHEIKIPQRDHVRASRNEVYEQCRADLEEAAQLLPDIDKVKDGKVNRQVAQHLLSEIYISLKMYDKAIKASTAVIDYPGVALMTERFGSQKDKDGDVYEDLFRLHNQNRTSGNTEGLYVLQYDHLNAGSKKSSNLNWSLIPFYVNIQISEKNGAGETIKNSAFAGPTDMKGGRCVGWMQPTNHFITEIWKKGSGYDIRNSVHNIVRDIKIDNPQSPAYGKWLVKDGYYKQLDSIRQWYPILTKLFSYRDYPDDIKAKSSNGEFIKTGFGEFVLLTTVQGGFKDESGYWITNPSSSPENVFSYIDKNGQKQIGEISKASTMDIALIWDLFTNCIQAANTLKTDGDFVRQLEKVKKHLYPHRLGLKGQLLEWFADFEEPEPEHRHLSHLYGLHPGNYINIRTTPDLAAAAKQSLLLRGDGGGIGWSTAWKTCFFARLEDSDNAYRQLKKGLKLVDITDKVSMVKGGGTLPNMFNTHPPFQIDGNFGGVAGIAEILLQSQGEEIFLLPAVPAHWSEGKIKGLRAKGGFIVDMYWKDNRLYKVVIVSTLGGNCRVRSSVDFVSANAKIEKAKGKNVNPFYPPIDAPKFLKKKNRKHLLILEIKKKNIIDFQTKAGQTYILLKK